MLQSLLDIPSPTGCTDQVIHAVAEELDQLDVAFELTRRGAIRGTLHGQLDAPARAVVAHVDTLGAMVTHLQDNGRLKIRPIGTWSSRFAEGARVNVLSQGRAIRGTVLPLKASGHIYHEEIDTQPNSWENLEVRLDERVSGRDDLVRLGTNVGDYVVFDPNTEISDNGFINTRYLDDKAGVAILLAATQALKQARVELPVQTHLLFTISEEVGSGASAVLHGEVAEMVAVDNGVCGPGQHGDEHGVTVVAMDLSGPFDYHLTAKLRDLCHLHRIPCTTDTFKHYRCDAASAVEAGNDIRTALMCFGVDATHGYERTHIDSLRRVAELLTFYLQTPLTIKRDRKLMGPLSGFPTQEMA
jgi:peptidase M42 family hydrolase